MIHPQIEYSMKGALRKNLRLIYSRHTGSNFPILLKANHRVGFPAWERSWIYNQSDEWYLPNTSNLSF